MVEACGSTAIPPVRGDFLGFDHGAAARARPQERRTVSVSESRPKVDVPGTSVRPWLGHNGKKATYKMKRDRVILFLCTLAAQLGCASLQQPVYAGITKVTFSGTIANFGCVPDDFNANNCKLDESGNTIYKSPWGSYTTGQNFSFSFALNSAVLGAADGNAACGNSYYSNNATNNNYLWYDNKPGCATKLFNRIEFTGITSSAQSLDATTNEMSSYSSANFNIPADGNPFFSGFNYGGSGISAVGGPAASPVPLSSFNFFPLAGVALPTSSPAYNYSFNASYNQPYVVVGTALPSPVEFMQYYYGSGSYYRDFSIANTSGVADNLTPYTGSPQANISFGEGGKTIIFNVTGMDIITPAPAPLPLLGASAAMAFSRRLKKRIRSVR
jgi:hypothetical protein